MPIYLPEARFSTDDRLKVLKDEIRKPYFLKLKQFLWDQGVRGASDTPNNVKVYPARVFSLN